MRSPSRLVCVPAAFALLTILALPLAPAAVAQWSDDPAANVAIADGAGEQILPEIGHTSDGGLWIGWFDNSGGSYAVRVQRLDAAGVEQFPHNGLLVSNHPQDTALFGWNMIADSDDHAVLVFSDTRDGGDLDIHAYRIAPDGTFVWGADGITLSDNADFEPAPRVAETSDHEFVVAWLRDPATGDGDIRMQRLTAGGTPLLAAGGQTVIAATGESPGFVEIAPSDNGSVILSYLRDIATFASSRHVRAQKIGPTGAALWAAPVSVYDAYSVPIGYFPKILPDGSAGAWLCWHRSDGNFFNSFVQHLDKDGVEQFAHNGVAVSTVGTMYHLDPAMVPGPAGGVLVFWNERNSLQSQWGILGQSISSAGTRLWGPSGVTLLPVDTNYKSFPRAVPLAGGAEVVLTRDGASGDELIAMRVDDTGAQVWSPALRTLSSAPSGKSRYPVGRDDAGTLATVWEDSRNGAADLYGQVIRPDGSLGAPSGAGDVGATLRIDHSPMTPGDVVLSWGASCSAGAVDSAIYEGVLGDFTSHVMRLCGDPGGDGVEEITPAAGDRYYLVVPLAAAAEGSYGRDSAGVERPPASAPADRCQAAQDVSGCMP